jgi:sterol desaturase/sphingolipid hydroxylase (fatty acid hydroxylase superfamily)
MSFNLLLGASHILSYFIFLGYYFHKDLDAFSRGIQYWEQVKLQKYTPKIWKVWSEGLIKSTINVCITCTIMQFTKFDNKAITITEILKLPMYVLLIDLYLFIVHKLLHTPFLYKYHKQHHISNLVAASSVFDADVVEHIILNVGSFFIPYFILGWPNIFVLIGLLYITRSSISSHAGYNGSKHHNKHHQLLAVNFGAGLYFWDKIFGTFEY